jgi:putative ABC transport system substrate-binding protein
VDGLIGRFKSFAAVTITGMLGASHVMQPVGGAQASSHLRVIAILSAGALTVAPKPLVEGLAALGWTEGKQIVLLVRHADGVQERLPQLAQDLVAQKVDVIVTYGTPAALAAKAATRTIPIVLGGIGDPVHAGVVPSLARPGGNITGISLTGPELGRKRLELIKTLLPKARRIGILTNAANPMYWKLRDEEDAISRSLDLETQRVEAAPPIDLTAAFGTLKQLKIEALIVYSDPIFYSQSRQIMELALRHGIPTFAEGRRFAIDGGLLSYSADFVERTRRTAWYVDRVLRGENPADLPIQQPTTFELVINLKTAKVLGIDVPPTVLVRADEVIE